MRILHVITNTEFGGAQRQLQNLCLGLAARGHEQRVLSLATVGPLGRQMAEYGLAVDSLGMLPRLRSTGRIAQLPRLIRRFRPDVVDTWMYHADFAGALAVALAGRPPLCWNILCSDIELHCYRWTTAVTVRLCARLSAFPHAVVANSHAGEKVHKALGYRPRRWLVIPNGFDTETFAPGPHRMDVRRHFALPENCELVGMVARYDPMKDYSTLLAALAELCTFRRSLHAVLVGEGVDDSNAVLAAAIGRHALHGRVRLAGSRDDVAWLLPGLDVFCLSSLSEGLPNVLGEAMSCGVPCVASDVGDCAAVLGDTGCVVPPRSPAALATALRDLLNESPVARHARSAACRRRIIEQYPLRGMVERYENLYTQIVRDARGRSSELESSPS